jgi:hypothetical protein
MPPKARFLPVFGVTVSSAPTIAYYFIASHLVVQQAG